jgi:transcriptional regulator with XRE-family HTH domain
MGVDGSTVNRWEAGAKEPDLATIAKLAVILGVDAGELAFGDVANRPSGSGSVSVDPADATDVVGNQRKGGGGAA